MAYQLGIDVSKWQESVDWNRARTAGIKFTYIKAVDGTWEDRGFKGHWAGSKDAGLLRGVYHYYRDDQDPKVQARKLLDVLNSTGDQGELPPALDIEETNNRTLTASKIKLCLEELERLFGRTPLLYTRATIWNPRIGKVTWAAKYPLWIAHYTVAGWGPDHMQRILNTQPTIPTAWTSWAIWQVSDKAPASDYGVSGNTADLDFIEAETLTRLSTKPIPGDTQNPPTGHVNPPPTPSGGGSTGGSTGGGTSGGSSTDPFDTKVLPAVTSTLAIKVVAAALNLRRTTSTANGLPNGPTNGSLARNAVKNVLEVTRLEDRIWARVGVEQWAVVEKRDGTVYAQFVNT